MYLSFTLLHPKRSISALSSAALNCFENRSLHPIMATGFCTPAQAYNSRSQHDAKSCSLSSNYLGRRWLCMKCSKFWKQLLKSDVCRAKGRENHIWIFPFSCALPGGRVGEGERNLLWFSFLKQSCSKGRKQAWNRLKVYAYHHHHRQLSLQNQTSYIQPNVINWMKKSQFYNLPSI